MDSFRYIGYGASIVGVFVLIMIAVERMKGDNLRKNASGYYDPTAYQAILRDPRR